MFSRVCLSATPWTVAHQAPVHGILQAGILERVTIPTPGHLPYPGIELTFPTSPALQVDSKPLSHLESPLRDIIIKDYELNEIVCY